MISKRLHSDVAVVGGGPAGIAAATCAAEGGARVTVVDSGFRPGGQIWRHRDPSELPATARQWIERCKRAGVRWISQATVVDGTYEHGLTVVHADGTLVLRAERIVLATGARELLLPYPGWTLPNVVGAGGGQALLKGGLDVRDRHVVIAGSGPLLLPVAAAMAKAGARLIAVAEQAPARQLISFGIGLWSQPAKIVLAARYRWAIPPRVYHTGTWVARADGSQRVQTVVLTNGRRSWTLPCDLLCCGFGLVPNTELARLLGCKVEDDRVNVDALQRTSVTGVLSAGESTGVAGDAAAIVEGQIAGLVAVECRDAPRLDALRRQRDRGERFSNRLAHAFAPRESVRALADRDTIVCRCEDVRFGDLDRSWTGRQAKLYARVGMGPCQGAVCGPGLQHLFGWPSGSVRPPLYAPALDAWAAEDSNHDGSTSDAASDSRESS